jgi:hypothetical protein
VDHVVGKDDRHEPDDNSENQSQSLPSQFLDLLTAGGNLVRKGVDTGISSITGNPVKSDNGSHNAKSFRDNLGVGYQADENRSWRDDLNDSIFTLDDNKRKTAMRELGKRASDTGLDLLYEGGTDPLSYGGGTIVSKAVSGGAKALGVGKGLSKVVGRMAVGGGLGAANTASQYEDGGRPHMGALEGASIFGLASPVIEGAFAMANSAGDSALSSYLKGKTADYAKMGGENLAMENYPKLKAGVQKINQRGAYLAHEIRQGRLKSLEGLSESDNIAVNEFMKSAKSAENVISQDAYYKSAENMFGKEAVESHKVNVYQDLYEKAGEKRKAFLTENGLIAEEQIGSDLIDEYHDLLPKVVDVNRATADAIFKARDSSGKLGGYMWNLSRSNAQKAIQSSPEIEQALGNLSSSAMESTEKWASHNSNILQRYNKAKGFDEVFDPNISFSVVKKDGAKSQFIADGKVPVSDRSGVYTTEEGLKKLQTSPMVGFKYHTDDVFDKKSFELSKEVFATPKAGFKRGVVGGSDAADRLVEADGISKIAAYDKTYAVYSEQAAGAFLSNVEKEATATVRSAQRYIKENVPLADQYDRLNSIWKRNVLYLSASWVKQQYYDNLGKTYIENGLGDALKFGSSPTGMNKALYNDIDNVLKGNASHISSAKANEYVKYNVAGSDILTDVKGMTDAEKRLRFRPDSDVFDQKKDWIDRAGISQEQGYGVAPLKAMYEKTGEFGQRLELNARAITYEHIVKDLTNEVGKTGKINPEMLDAIRTRASAMTGKIFFDYKDVTAIEQEAAKRLFPFYSFVSKNVRYYADTLTNPNKIGRINTLNRISNVTGSNAERDEEVGNAIANGNPYLANGNARLLQGDGDSVVLSTNSKAARNDALMGLTSPLDLMVKSTNPMIKGLAEMFLSKRDSFSDQPLDPAKNPYGGKNWLGQKGYQGMLLNKLDPNFTSTPNYSLSDVAKGDVKVSRLGKDALSLMLGSTGVRAGEKTGSPETDSKATMYNHQFRKTFPILPAMGGLGTAYNIANSPVVDMLGQILYQSMTDDDGKTLPIDPWIKLMGSFDLIKKDVKAIKAVDKKTREEHRNETKKFNKDEKIRSKND